MKIAMMSPWNVACGVSTHAELIGKEWIKAGHKLKLLAPIEEKTQPVTAKDEPYITRCYTIDRDIKGILKPLSLDPKPFLESDYDFFIVQNLELMPIGKLLEIWPQIKAKARTILVIHEGYLPPYPEFYQLDFDAYICFDERYVREFSKKFPPEKIHIICYPCHPLKLGDKRQAREKLGLPQDKKIVLSYGIAVQQHLLTLLPLEDLSQIYPLLYLVLAAEGRSEILGKAQDRYSFIQIRDGERTVNELYDYLHAADALLLYKQSPSIVVSSTVYVCLGSGCPIVILEGRFTEELGKEVLKYRDFDELKEVLFQVFEGGRSDQKAVEKFMAEKSAGSVAREFIELFKSLLMREVKDAYLWVQEARLYRFQAQIFSEREIVSCLLRKYSSLGAQDS